MSRNDKTTFALKKIDLKDLMEEKYPMHCIAIEDLLAFESLPRHDAVEKLSKFVIPELNDERPIIFISHQWTGYTEPDPTGLQFRTLVDEKMKKACQNHVFSIKYRLKS